MYEFLLEADILNLPFVRANDEGLMLKILLKKLLTVANLQYQLK